MKSMIESLERDVAALEQQVGRLEAKLDQALVVINKIMEAFDAKADAGGREQAEGDHG